MKLDDLVRAGVTRTANWERGPNGIAVAGSVPRGAGLYMFVVGADIRYVGSTSQGLSKRMNFYRREQNDNKSMRPVHAELTGAIGRGETVEIFVREIANADRTMWNGMPVSLLLGVEAALIEDLNPPWNRRGRKLT